MNTPSELLKPTSYINITSLGSDGGLHKIMICNNSAVADKLVTGPEAV